MKHLFFTIALISYGLLSAQNNNNNNNNAVVIPPSSLISGLSNDIAATVPIYLVQTTASLKNCLETLKNLSLVNKEWDALVHPGKNNSPAHKVLALTLSKKFALAPNVAVAWGKEVLDSQLARANKTMEKFAYLKSAIGTSLTPSGALGEYWYREECLGHAIMQNNKEIVTCLCLLPNIQANYLMKVRKDTLPLLAIAVKHNKDENDLAIIESLLKAGANPELKYGKKKNANTPLDLALDQGKPKIKAELEKYKKNRLEKKLDKFLENSKKSKDQSDGDK